MSSIASSFPLEKPSMVVSAFEFCVGEIPWFGFGFLYLASFVRAIHFPCVFSAARYSPERARLQFLTPPNDSHWGCSESKAAYKMFLYPLLCLCCGLHMQIWKLCLFRCSVVAVKSCYPAKVTDLDSCHPKHLWTYLESQQRPQCWRGHHIVVDPGCWRVVSCELHFLFPDS